MSATETRRRARILALCKNAPRQREEIVTSLVGFVTNVEDLDAADAAKVSEVDRLLASMVDEGLLVRHAAEEIGKTWQDTFAVVRA